MKIFLMLVSLVVVVGRAHATFFTNGVTVDALVRAAASTSNYGGAGALSVCGQDATNGLGVTNGLFDSFLRFNGDAMVTNFNFLFGTNNWVINGARLRVTEMGAPPNAFFNRGTGGFEIRWIANDNWTEGTGSPNAPAATGIKYNDEPALLSVGIDVSLGTFTNAGVDGTLSLPLALPGAFVNDLAAGGEVGFYLTAIDPVTGFTFSSRNFGTSSARPFVEISAVPRPGLTGISLSGTNLMLAATNGAAGGTYYVLTSTNVALPINQWLPVATNVLIGSGSFIIPLTNAVNTSTPDQQFFILQTQ